jgi:hypothetical protein
MELPSVDASSSVYFKYTDHFAGAVQGWSDAEIITTEQRKAVTDAGPIVDAAATTLRNALTSRANAERDATQLRARYFIRDIVLDKRIMATSDAVLNGPAMRDRQHPVFRAIFKDGTAGDITEAKVREEPELAARMRDRLADAADFDGKARVKSDLDEALAKSLSTRDALDAAETAENKAGDGELQARIAVRTALEQAYGLLRAAFPGQRKLVESFFYRAERRSKKAPSNESGSIETP